MMGSDHSRFIEEANSFFKKDVEKFPRQVNDTISEVYDPVEKQALFDHSMTKGLFNNIRNSPLKDKMPARMQMYEAYNLKGFDQSASPAQGGTANFKEFKLTQPKGLNFETDFTFNPKKFFCKKHPNMEIEFCCEINEEFYCKKCLPDHEGHKTDKVLNSILLGLQERLQDLKQNYQTKKRTLIEKLNHQQRGIEQIFKMYYD